MTVQLGVIADDITGAAMVASLLEAAGIRTPVVSTPDAIAAVDEEAEAVVYAGTYRLAPPHIARAEVRDVADALRRRGCRRLYAKYSATFDSTDDGNIGPVAEELCDVLETGATVFVPGFPESWITVFHGKMFVAHDLLADSFKQFDPVTPMTDSDLVRVLQAQTSRPVGLIDHAVLARGPDAVRRRLQRRIDGGERFFVVDSVDDADIAACAAAVADWPVLTGADAFVPAVASAAGLTVEEARRTRFAHPPTPGRTAVLAGSCAFATLAQLDAFEAQHPVRRIDIATVADIDSAARRAAEWAVAHDPSRPVAVATSATADAVDAARSARADASAIATAVIARTAELLFENGFRNFVVAGGETTGAVLDALDVENFEVTAFDELGGGLCSVTTPEPMTILCKAGAVGGPDLFLAGLDRMHVDGHES